ncbi:MAG: type I 3-dehydroquinate dehydratase [Candidatus Omnitrophota bacterium]|nr:type I 3-dehydroquinate dehydratase [Candidatus Omnitrophota bacterium]
MPKINNLKLGQAPRTVLTVGDKENLKAISHKRADLLELRVDRFEKISPAYVTRIIRSRRKTGLPLILTIRDKKEGGGRFISDQAKLKLFNSVVFLVDALDIELNSAILARVVKIAHSNKKTVIISYHNLKTTPGIKRLKSIALNAKRQGADIIKVAVNASKVKDVATLLEFTLGHKQKNLVTISLGKTGTISRLFFPLAGSLFTYAYLDKPFGSGQLPLALLQKHLSLYYPAHNKSVS